MSKASKLLERLEPLWEMANLDVDDTGIPNIIIYVSEAKHSCGPRIKVAKHRGETRSHRNSFSVSISFNPEVVAGNYENIVDSETLKKILAWVKLNERVLLDYWNSNLSTSKMIKNIKKVRIS